MNKFTKGLFRNMPLIMGFTILLMDGVAFLAPIFAHFGMDEAAHAIYFVYGFLCHQRPWRSLHLYDYQAAWCARDTFIYLSMGLSAIFVVKFKIRGIKWYVPLLCTLPFALDGTVQLIAEILGVLRDEMEFFYASTNFIRMLTGAVFGAGAGLWLFGMLDETIEEEIGSQSAVGSKRSGRKNLLYFVLIIVICLVSYVGLIGLWGITSTKYKPGNFIDHVRYFPGVNYEDTGIKHDI